MNKRSYYLIVLVMISACSPSIEKKYLFVRQNIIRITKQFDQHVSRPELLSIKMPDSLREAYDTVSIKELKKQLSIIERNLALMPDSITFKKEVIRDEKGMIKSMSMVPDMNEVFIYNKNKIKYIRKHHLDTSKVKLIEKNQ